MSGCPNCNSKNAYCGLYGWKCDSPSCSFYDGISREDKKEDKENDAVLPEGIFTPSTSITATITVSDPIQQQQDVAIEVLEKLEKLGCVSLVAGGAPRNWDLKIKARDLDIFTTKEWLQHTSIKNIFPNINKVNKIYPRSQKSFAHSVHEFQYKGEIVQIITLKNFKQDFNNQKLDFAEEVFKTFDWHVCKIYMNSSGIIWKTTDYIDDIKNKRLTLNITNVEKYNRVSKLPERFRKMKSLFPNFEAIIV